MVSPSTGAVTAERPQIPLRRETSPTNSAGHFVSISCGGLADWGFGVLRDRKVPLNVIFGIFAGAAFASVVLVLLIRPRKDLNSQEQSY